ncbi:MAG: NAD(+) synthase, partial [Oscillospiraceae bacterium]|nr:NAD(+) synthase [Oscillospiraceae bacterium]
MRDGFIKVAAGTPKIRVADCGYNAGQIIALIKEAAAQGIKVLALPELCVTGYTCGDLFLQDTLLDGAVDALQAILEGTKELDVFTALGMPLRANGKLYNCAVVIQRGEVLSVGPKTYQPNYGEFYETRWFESAPKGIHDFLVQVPTLSEDEGGYCLQPMFGSCALIECPDVPGLKVGVEICEDLWAIDPPSSRMAANGATLILNLSASDEVAGKADYRRQLVTGQSARCVCGYVYA